MSKGILGRKIGMTQIFSAQGELIPVTVIEAEANVVLQVKTAETDDVASAYASTYPIALVLIVIACNLMINLMM